MDRYIPEINVRNVLTAAFLWNTVMPEWMHWLTSPYWIMTGIIVVILWSCHMAREW